MKKLYSLCSGGVVERRLHVLQRNQPEGMGMSSRLRRIKSLKQALNLEKLPFFLLLLAIFSLAATVDIVAQTIAVSSVTSNPVCQGSTVTVNFTATSGTGGSKYKDNTSFTVYLGANNGAGAYSQIATFTLPNAFSNAAQDINEVSVNLTIPNATANGTYKLSIGSTGPVFNGSTGNGGLAGFVVGPPNAPTSPISQSVVYGTSNPSLTATVPVGQTIKWYDASGTLMATANSFTPTSAQAKTSGTYTYYAEAVNGNCVSATRTPVTLTISPKTLTISGVSAVSRVYNGNTVADLTGTAALVGVVPGESLTIGTDGKAAFFNSKTVGSNKPVTVSGYTVSGATATNYTLVQPAGLTANISPKPLYITSPVANGKVYDGATATTIAGTLTGVVLQDAVNWNNSGTFATANAGNGIAVTSTGGLTGDDMGNYTLTRPANLTANITPKPLNITATGLNKTYDGTTAASVIYNVSGSVNGDNITALGSAAFDSKDYGSQITIRVTGITISGAQAANYTVNSSTTTSASIDRLHLVISAACQDKVYDGTVSTAIVSNGTAVSLVTLTTNLVKDDKAIISYRSEFADKSVGQQVVLVSNISIAGDDARNYTLPASVSPTSAVISPRVITGTFTARDKVFDNNISAEVLTRGLVGQVEGDKVQLVGGVAKFETSAVGSGKEVTLTGAALDGEDAGNYILESIAIARASIYEVAPLPVTLLSFEGKQINGSVKLSWKTAAEKDNDYFQVERSQDGKTFARIGQVKGNGTSNVLQSYGFSDASAPAGTVYYRLKQVDFNGKFEYSKVIAVKAEGKAVAQVAVNVYPNPTTGKVYLTSTQLNGAATVTMYDGTGRVVSQNQVELEVGQPVSVDMTTQAAGVYYLQVQTAAGQSTSRVVKQ